MERRKKRSLIIIVNKDSKNKGTKISLKPLSLLGGEFHLLLFIKYFFRIYSGAHILHKYIYIYILYYKKIQYNNFMAKVLYSKIIE